MIKTKTAGNNRVNQGDIFRDVPYIESLIEKGDLIEVKKIIFPYVIVLTQDCDLEQDHITREKVLSDKNLISVLVAPLYNAIHVFNGEHLSDLGINSTSIDRNNTPGKYLERNQRPRYHYLEFSQDSEIVDSIIDFKHYFSVNIYTLEELMSTNYICTVSELFRESISQRFASFLSRIGLPI